MRHTLRSTAALAALGLAALTPTMARAQTQDLFVANPNVPSISQFAGTGPGTFSTTTATLTAPSLANPAGLAFDVRGDLFAGNSGNNTITEFAGAGRPGPATTLTDPSLSTPGALAFDARGDLFVGNGGGGNNGQGDIIEFTAGATPGTFGATTTLNDPSLNFPSSLALDARGDLFATNAFGNTITEFMAGAKPGTFGTTTTLTSGLDQPTGLAFDALGDLFAANIFGGSNDLGTITEFAFNPLTGTIGNNGFQAFGGPNSGLNNPDGLAFDARGDLFAANFAGNNGQGSIIEFAAGAAPGTFGGPQTVETSVTNPDGLAFGPPVPVPPPVPEASTTVSLGLLLMLGMGGVVVAKQKRKPGLSA